MTKRAPLASLLLILLATPVNHAAVNHKAYVYGWNESASWTVYENSSAAGSLSGNRSATYNNCTWTVLWDTNAAQGSVRLRNQVTNNQLGTNTVVQSSAGFYDTFTVGAGTSGLSNGTSVTLTLTGKFNGSTWVDALNAQTGNTTLGYAVGVYSGVWTEPFQGTVSQDCYTAGSPGTINVNLPFSLNINTTVGSSVDVFLRIGPLGSSNPGTQSSGCTHPGQTAGFDITGSWTTASSAAGTAVTSAAGWTPVPEPKDAGVWAAVCAALAGVVGSIVLKKRK